MGLSFAIGHGLYNEIGSPSTELQQVGTLDQPVVTFSYKRNEGLPDGIMAATKECNNGVKQIKVVSHLIDQNQAIVICNFKNQRH